MALLPFPRRPNNRLQVRRWAPSQDLLRSCRVRAKPGRVAGTSRFDARLNRAACDFSSRLDHFENRIAVSCPQIEKIGGVPFAQMFERADMGVSEVRDVHIIANRRAVRG